MPCSRVATFSSMLPGGEGRGMRRGGDGEGRQKW